MHQRTNLTISQHLRIYTATMYQISAESVAVARPKTTSGVET